MSSNGYISFATGTHMSSNGYILFTAQRSASRASSANGSLSSADLIPTSLASFAFSSYRYDLGTLVTASLRGIDRVERLRSPVDAHTHKHDHDEYYEGYG